MTWAQASTRKFDFVDSRTSSKVGPGSYDITKAYERKTKSALLQTFPSGERNAFPRPEIVTPGPGAYNYDQESNVKRPASSFFQSRSTRDVYKVTNNVPGADTYSQLTEWGKIKKGVPPPNRPKRRQRVPHVPETANYLDEKGRLVRRKERKRTEADIGPGTYSPQDTTWVQTSEINRSNRNEDVFNVRKIDTPGPTKYTIPDVNTKLPITISNKTGSVLVHEITQAIGKPTHYTVPKGQNSIFKSKVNRKSYYDVDDEVPGPGAYKDEEIGAIKPKTKSEFYDTGVVFGTRSVRFDKNLTDSPGPSYYSPKVLSKRDERAASALKNRAKTPNIFPGNDVVGPGAYDIPEEKLKPQLSPAFADREPRLPSSENDIPGPADYNIDFPVEKPASVFETRYSKYNDWAFSNMSDAPSAEKFTIDRSLGSRGWTISRNRRFRPNKDDGMAAPGQYDYHEPFVKPSFNSAVHNLE